MKIHLFRLLIVFSWIKVPDHDQQTDSYVNWRDSGIYRCGQYISLSFSAKHSKTTWRGCCCSNQLEQNSLPWHLNILCHCRVNFIVTLWTLNPQYVISPASGLLIKTTETKDVVWLRSKTGGIMEVVFIVKQLPWKSMTRICSRHKVMFKVLSMW